MIVIDATVWMSFLLKQDVNHAATHPWLTGILVSKTPVVAPILLLAEVGGAMSRRLGSPDMGEKAINRLLSIPTLRLVDMDHTQGIQTSRIAANHRLRGADACYVAVAVQLGVPLVSWDKEHIHRAASLITAYTPGDDK
jgi:predicted nucleic acid-binding protein